MEQHQGLGVCGVEREAIHQIGTRIVERGVNHIGRAHMMVMVV